jgi:hypothetical protein
MTSKKILKQIVTEILQNSPNRDWSIETLKNRDLERFKSKQKEMQDYIDECVEMLYNE